MQKAVEGGGKAWELRIRRSSLSTKGRMTVVTKALYLSKNNTTSERKVNRLRHKNRELNRKKGRYQLKRGPNRNETNWYQAPLSWPRDAAHSPYTRKLV